MKHQNPLIGKQLLAIDIADDREALRFVTSDEEIIVRCDADCCSHTWIEHIELPALGLPATVAAVENLVLSDPQWDSSDNYIQFYGCKITTDKGELVVDYRNSSNGYYGGSLDWSYANFYGGVFGQNVSTMQWQRVTADQ